MPKGLAFQRKHRRIGYKLKYFYYLLKKRDIIEKKTCYGKLNPDKTYFIVKPDYQDCVEGLLSLVYRQVLYINYALSQGFIPFVDWKRYKTQYSDGNNAWEYFFKQPSNVTEEEVYSSKNVYLSGWTFKDINQKGYFSSNVFFDDSLLGECNSLFKKCLSFSDEVNRIVELEEQNLNVIECVGVYVRGTDYVRLKPSGEYIQPTPEQVIEILDVFLAENKVKSIFLVTEDGDIFDKFKEKYCDSLKIVSFDSFIRGYTGQQVLSKSNILKADKKQRGQEYLVKMILLSKCRYFVGSITQGSKFSYILNGGKYEDKYIFDLGLYR